MAKQLIDSYEDYSSVTFQDVRSGSELAQGQCFTATVGGNLYQADFLIKRTGTPSGLMVATLYNITGTFGTSGVPTGAAIATSDGYDVSNITTDTFGTWYSFFFNGANKVTLTQGSTYGIALQFGGGDASNFPAIGYRSSGGGHGGNLFFTTNLSSWSATAGGDTDFRVYIELGGYVGQTFGSSYSGFGRY